MWLTSLFLTVAAHFIYIAHLKSERERPCLLQMLLSLHSKMHQAMLFPRNILRGIAKAIQCNWLSVPSPSLMTWFANQRLIDKKYVTFPETLELAAWVLAVVGELEVVAGDLVETWRPSQEVSSSAPSTSRQETLHYFGQSGGRKTMSTNE